MLRIPHEQMGLGIHCLLAIRFTCSREVHLRIASEHLGKTAQIPLIVMQVDRRFQIVILFVFVELIQRATVDFGSLAVVL